MIDNYEVTIKTFSIKLGEEIELDRLKGLVEEAENEGCGYIQFGEPGDLSIAVLNFKKIMSAEFVKKLEEEDA